MLISHVHDEILEALETAKELNFNAKPLYWIIPKRHKEGEFVSSVMESLPYVGFKIHPRAHNWDIEDSFTSELFTETCNYAATKVLPIIIHTGESPEDNPNKFIKWFEMFPTVQFVLAHCRPIDTVIHILHRYNNIYGDSSFVPEEYLIKLQDAGLSDRILYGTDYPVNSSAYITKPTASLDSQSIFPM